MDHIERTLWELPSTGSWIRCVMRSCCSGAELQVWRVDAEPGRADADGLRRPVSRPRVDWDSAVIELRELYPTRSDVYERARALETAYRESFAPPNARP